MDLTVYCRGRDCHHRTRLDLEALANQLGEDVDLYAVDLRPRMRCKSCGERGATFIISPP